jgi:hypothetical protein
MSSLKHLACGPEPRATEALRRALARVLRRSSAILAELALRLGQSAAPLREPDPHLEFHAEAGAPEGALYFDGRLVGFVAGVNRL